MFQINYKIITFLLTLFVVINTISYKIIQKEEQQKIEILLAGHVKNLSTYYEMVLFDQKRRSLAVSQSTFLQKDVLDIFTKANETHDKSTLDNLRKQLYKLLKSKYKILQTEGILQYHFIFPNNVTFFRMHKPSKYNDDLSSVRLDFVEANKYHKEIHGFHQGKTTHGFRNIYPIYAKNGQYLGLLDVAFSSQVLQDYMNGVGKIHTHFLVKKDIFDTKSWQRDDMKAKYIQSHEHKDYMIGISKYFNENDYKKNAVKLNDLQNSIAKKIYRENKFAIFKKLDNKTVVISFYPIRSSITNKLSAWLVSYEPDESIALIQKESNYYFIVLFIVISILFLFLAIFMHVNKISLLQIDNKYQRKLFFILVSIFIIIIGSLYVGLNYMKNESIKSYIQTVIKENKREYLLLKERNKIFSQHIFEKHLNTKQIKLLFKQQKRKALYKLLKNDYKNWKKEFHIEQVQFHTPDAHSFLRIHKPEKYGDTLSGFRKGVEYVSKHKTAFEGFEEGKVHSGFRYIYPLFLDKEYLGSVEVSFTSIVFIKNLASSFGKKMNILFSSNIIQNNMFKEYQSEYVKSPIDGFYFNKEILTYLSTKNKKIKSFRKTKEEREDTKEKILQGDIFAKYYKSVKELVVIIPIRNKITKEIIVSLHILNDNQYIVKQERVFIYNFISSAIVLLLIVLIIYKTLTEKQKYMIQQVEQTHYLEKSIQEALAENTRQLQVLQQQTKMAAMGEMIGAIAHQWRQPLNAVGLSIQNLEYDYKMGLIDEKFIEEYIEENTKTIEFMSKTIDDFRNFFRVDKEKKLFSIKEAIQETLRMQSAQLNNHHIKVLLEGGDTEYLSLKGEFQQVILNIINNAKDALLEKQTDNPQIKITIDKKHITIEDNAGGIPDDIIDRVFEPYFTTKEQGKGTGMGLYMSKMIIEENMSGALSVENKDGYTTFSIDFS